MRYYSCNIDMTYETSLKQYTKHVEHYYATCEHYKATWKTWPMQHSHAIKETFIALMKHYYATYETYEHIHVILET
jgi:hypothetical protein